MNRVDIAADGIGDLHWHRVDLHGYAKRRQRLCELLKKLRHRNGPERDVADFAVARAADHFVRQKVEFDVERHPAICRRSPRRSAAPPD